MSVDLRRMNGEEFSFSTINWAIYLNIAAIAYDWPKAGTQPPESWSAEDGEWVGAYDWNAGQTVTETDAAALADALASYLSDPNKNEVLQEMIEGISEAIGFEIEVSPDDDRDYIASFVQFARSGAFQVW